MKQKLAIIAGGDSGEYHISMKSGIVVFEMTDREIFEPYLIEIKGTEWYHQNDGKKYPINKDDFTLQLDDFNISFDCVFCAIHGTPGENGKMPAYFEMLNIPFTSSGSIVSALTFHKYFCNCVVKESGVKVPSSILLQKADAITADAILKKMDLPVFVKPNAGGSSVGMSKVKQPHELMPAISKAFGEDEDVLIERFIPGREFTCGVMQYKGELIVFPVCEIKSKNEFFDFESKYTPSLAQEIVPAEISESLENEIKNTSAFIFKNLRCQGVVRMDYIFSEQHEKLFFLEVNTVPGLTRESIIPKMAAVYGITLTGLFTMLVEDAIWRAKG